MNVFLIDIYKGLKRFAGGSPTVPAAALPGLQVLLLLLTVGSTLAEGTEPYRPTEPFPAAWGGYPVTELPPYQPATHGKPLTTLPPATTPAWPAPATYPPTYTPTSQPILDPAVRLAQAPPFEDGSPLLPTTEGNIGGKSLLPPGTRKGVFQKFKFTGTYLPQLESDSLGLSDLRTSVVLGVPLVTRETPLVIEPEYRARFLQRPDAPPLPSRLHDVAVQFRHFRRLSDRWIFDGAITLGLYADDHNLGAGDAFRPSGRALGIYQPTEAWNWVFGAVYLNRAGPTILPAVGLAYRTPCVKYELIFPRPRAAWLLPGSTIDCDERWAYVMGEFGGGRWAVTNPTTDNNDVLEARDLRILFGYERKIIGGVSWKYEMGYVFNREIEYRSGFPPSASLDDTFLVRAGFSY